MVPVPVPKKKPPTEDADIIELDDEEEEIDDVEEDVRYKKNLNFLWIFHEIFLDFFPLDVFFSRIFYLFIFFLFFYFFNFS